MGPGNEVLGITGSTKAQSAGPCPCHRVVSNTRARSRSWPRPNVEAARLRLEFQGLSPSSYLSSSTCKASIVEDCLPMQVYLELLEVD